MRICLPSKWTRVYGSDKCSLACLSFQVSLFVGPVYSTFPVFPDLNSNPFSGRLIGLAIIFGILKSKLVL